MAYFRPNCVNFLPKKQNFLKFFFVGGGRGGRATAPPTSPSSCVYDWRCFRKKLSLRISQYSQESCRHATLLKKESNTGFFQYCKFFKNIYFEEHLLTAAFDFLKQRQNTDEQLLLYRLG